MLNELTKHKFDELSRKEPDLTQEELMYKSGWDGEGRWTCVHCGFETFNHQVAKEHCKCEGE